MSEQLHTFDMMGIKVSNLTYKSLNNYILGCIQNENKSMVLNVNINAMNIAARNNDFRTVLSSAELVFADGMGIVYALKLLGRHLPGRITYADWLWDFAAFSANNNISWYLLGAKPGIADRASEILTKRYPKLRIAGFHHGYFEKNGVENQTIVKDINKKKPDVLIVAMGMPVQEKWICHNMKFIDSHVFLSGGACFDYLSGLLKRCPRWMGNSGLEWLFRLIQEPRRLSYRYLIGNPMFVYRFLKYYLSIKNRGKKLTVVN